MSNGAVAHGREINRHPHTPLARVLEGPAKLRTVTLVATTSLERTVTTTDEPTTTPKTAEEIAEALNHRGHIVTSWDEIGTITHSWHGRRHEPVPDRLANRRLIADRVQDLLPARVPHRSSHPSM